MENVTIRPALLSDIPAVRALLTDYVAWIGMDLAFQEIDAELAGLPGDYVPPRGALLVADEGGQVIGMIGLRPSDGAICEMKRLFVRPHEREQGSHQGEGVFVQRLARVGLAVCCRNDRDTGVDQRVHDAHQGYGPGQVWRRPDLYSVVIRQSLVAGHTHAGQ